MTQQFFLRNTVRAQVRTYAIREGATRFRGPAPTSRAGRTLVGFLCLTAAPWVGMRIAPHALRDDSRPPGTESNPRGVTMDEQANRLFEPESILPEQLGARSGSFVLQRPEAQLMLAVLEDAIATCRRHWEKSQARQPKEFRDALAWLESTDRSWLYSFENVCEILALPPAATRAGLLRLVSNTSEEAEVVYRTMLRHQAGARHAIRPHRVHVPSMRAKRSEAHLPRQRSTAGHE